MTVSAPTSPVAAEHLNIQIADLLAQRVAVDPEQIGGADLVAAGKDGARNVWALGAGAEILNTTVFGMRMPLRLGYRYRQLPFLSLGQGINESAASCGIGLSFARDRTTLDLAYEHGSRTTGAEKETFTTLFVGLTVRP